jgi:hypothetical protein
MFDQVVEAFRFSPPLISAFGELPETIPEVLMESALTIEAAGLPRPGPPEQIAETIVNEERPVLFVRNDWLEPWETFRADRGCGAGSRVLRYAAEYKTNAEPLATFIRRKGRINRCAERFTRCQRKAIRRLPEHAPRGRMVTSHATAGRP